MIAIKGNYELTDFTKAQALHARPSSLGTWSTYYVIGVLALGTFGGVLFAILGTLPWSYVLYPALILSIFVALKFILVPYQLKRVFNQQKELSAPFEIELSDEAFEVQNDFGFSRFPWNTFVKWKKIATYFCCTALMWSFT